MHKWVGRAISSTKGGCMWTGKCGQCAGAGKSSFWIHYNKVLFIQESSKDIKSTEMF